LLVELVVCSISPVPKPVPKNQGRHAWLPADGDHHVLRVGYPHLGTGLRLIAVLSERFRRGLI